MTRDNEDRFIVIPGTSRLVRKSDINAVNVAAVLMRSTKVEPPDEDNTKFRVTITNSIVFKNQTNYQSYIVEPPATDENDDEFYTKTTESNSELNEIEINSESSDLLMYIQMNNSLDEDKLKIVDSKVEWYIKTVDTLNKYNRLKSHIEAEKEENNQFNPIEIRDIDKITPNEVQLKKHEDFLRKNLPKQPDRLATIKKHIEVSVPLETQDNAFELANKLLKSGVISDKENQDIVNCIHMVLDSVNCALNENHVFDMSDEEEEDDDIEYGNDVDSDNGTHSKYVHEGKMLLSTQQTSEPDSVGSEEEED